MKTRKLFLLLLCFCFLPLIMLAQVVIKDSTKMGFVFTGKGNTINVTQVVDLSGLEFNRNSKLGFINTGENNTFNITQITQIIGKSPEYVELIKKLDDLDLRINNKIIQCKDFEKDNLTKYLKSCRDELNQLNSDRDSIKRIEKLFKQDVINLYDYFSRITIDDNITKEAKSLFEKGEISNVNTLLNFKKLEANGEALLLKVEHSEKSIIESKNDLKKIAVSLVLKAKAKATDYSDPMRIDSTELCYMQSLRYFDTVSTLYDFADFLNDNQQYEKSKETFKKVIEHPKVEDWRKAKSYDFLGRLYSATGNLNTAMEFSLKYYEAYKVLYQKDTTNSFNKNNLAIAFERLGNTHMSLGNLEKSLEFYEQYNNLEKQLYAAYPNNEEYKNNLAISLEKLGITTTSLGKLDKSLEFYKEYYNLEKQLYAAYPNNVEYKNNLATSLEKLGFTHFLGQFEQSIGVL